MIPDNKTPTERLLIALDNRFHRNQFSPYEIKNALDTWLADRLSQPETVARIAEAVRGGHQLNRNGGDPDVVYESGDGGQEIGDVLPEGGNGGSGGGDGMRLGLGHNEGDKFTGFNGGQSGNPSPPKSEKI